jgi:indole-3-glycerol phosphate synthase/phosphoribosylanthranilate isomerase
MPKGGRRTGRLATFLASARSRVAAGAYAPAGPALAPNGSLAARVRKGGAIIAELKPASPSEGRLLDRPAADVLRAYKAGGADALSILTDPDHFQGSPALLREAHAFGLPTLMKDFVVEEAQLDSARHNGASAVLLIERAIGAARREELVHAAHARGLEVLLEIFDAADWQAARSSEADLVGVNARDLDTLQVDNAAALLLLGQVAQERTGTTVALSGIQDRNGARLAFAAGAGGALVGTALLRSPHPDLLLRSLRRPLAKVCGLRTADDVAAAAKAGADLVGLVVGSPTSPRNLSTLDAQRLNDEARAAGLRTVLVTRSTELGAVREWCRLVRPDFLQLHGRATAEWVHSLRSIPTQVLFGVGPGEAVPADGAGAVLDGHADGGSGQAHDWRPVAAPGLTLVAGGLDASNAGEALRRSRAWGADASSRLESAPGRKDPARVEAFVQAVHAA